MKANQIECLRRSKEFEVNQCLLRAHQIETMISEFRALVELKNQLRTGRPRQVIHKTVEMMEGLLNTSGANLVCVAKTFGRP
jgi:hypothetical protein